MIAAFLAMAAASVPGSADTGSPPFPPTTGGTSGFLLPSRDALDLEYEAKAVALRAEMRALRKTDGGKLTPDHQMYLKEKLVLLLSAYRKDLQRVDRSDPSLANADGSPPR